MIEAMSSDTLQIERDTKTGRFLPGNSGNGGRKPGSRNRLGEQFLEDLRDLWETQGPDVLARVARDDPSTLLKVIASLMPRDLNITGSVDIGIDAGSVLQNFRRAVELLGNQAPARLPNVKVINGKS
jgi:hypothetical protein